MMLHMLNGKIHRATVTQAKVGYVGSITVDSALLEAAGIREYEVVQVADVDNGNRFETYTIAGEPGSGVICVNGAAGRLVCEGDKVIIMNYREMTEAEADAHRPRVVFVDGENHATRVTRYEKQGQLFDAYEDRFDPAA